MMLFVMFVVLTVAAAAIEAPPFTLSNGYFQVNDRQPVHLTHDNVSLHVTRGEEFQFWVTLKTSEHGPSPCSVADEEPCYFRYQIVRTVAGREEFLAGWKKGIGNHFDESATWSIGSGSPEEKVMRTLPPGEALLVFSIVKHEKEVFRKQFPLEIH